MKTNRPPSTPPKLLKHLLPVLAMVVIADYARAQERSAEDAVYYKKWVGCKAPPISFDRSDRTNYMVATVKGKQVLLYSFDAGNFVDQPDFPRLTDELQSLHRVRTNLANPFVVIGYSRGVLWNPTLGMVQIPKEIEEASRFPIVNLNNKRHENALGEPYDLLLSPGGILVGTNGIICSVFLQPMTPDDFKSIVSIPAWLGPPHEPPRRDSEK
jgi:hypothetical protein